tara:strand:+ start:52 stop:258 length:207 start_codon:yes stop_codon:yes gene_type:complete
MIGEYTVKIGDKLFDYTNANDIPEKFDHLIKFVPTSPPEPHSEEEHKLIDSFMNKFREIQKRGIKDNG